MNVTIEDISETRKKLLVTVTADEMTKADREVMREISKQAKVPGFRPGKAPEAMIRRRYADAIKEELGRKVTSEAYEAARNEAKFEIFGLIDLDEPEALNPGVDAFYGFTVDIMPEFELPAYEGLDIHSHGAEVAEDQIDEAILNERNQRADFQEVDREASEGDYVKISYEGTLDGQPIAELVPDQPIYGKQENTWEEAGGDHSVGVGAIMDVLVGLKPGDSTETEHTFPEDFAVEALAGKTAQYTVSVHEVRERVLPDLNDDFFKSLQVKDEEEFRSRIRSQLESNSKAEDESHKRRQVIQKLSEAVDFGLPESMVEQETQRVMRDIMIQNMQRGVTEEQFEEHKEALYNQARESALANVKTEILLSKIAEKENVEVTDEDMSQAIYMEAMQTRQQPDEIVKSLQKDRDRIRSMQRSIIFRKTLSSLVEKANVTIVEGSCEDHDH